MAASRGPAAEQRLASAGHRLTPQRRLILDALRGSRQTVSAPDLFERLRASHPNIGRATVFRNLDALVETGLAQRFEREGHVYAYASCSDEHHHHLVCSRCHRATEIAEDVVNPVISALHGRYGFSVEHASLDFYGICAACAAATVVSSPGQPTGRGRAARRTLASSAPPPTRG